MTQHEPITAARAREIFHYDPDSGNLIRRVDCGWRRCWKAGEIVGGLNAAGYVMIWADGGRYYAHRIIWLWMTGTWPVEIDHVDLDRANNRWANLRHASRANNMANIRRFSSNKSGFKGVHWHKACRKWCAQTSSNGVMFHLGVFETIADAKAAYELATKKHHGEFVRNA